MNTTITIKVVRADEPTVLIQNRIEEAFFEFDRIVQKYTRFNETSQLAELNRNSGKWVNIDEEFFQLITFMLDLADKTKGAFDPTIIDFLELYGYDKNYDFSKLNNPDLDNFISDLVKNRPSYKDIQLDNINKKVKLVKGQRIDLGGVGKGYAIDCAYEKLANTDDQLTIGIKNFLIDAGGDVRVSGENELKTKWKIGLKTKTGDKEELVGYVELTSSEALASSGSWARRVGRFHHLINPKSGMPHTPQYSTIFVRAEKAIVADAWATALFINNDYKKINIPQSLKLFYA